MATEVQNKSMRVRENREASLKNWIRKVEKAFEGLDKFIS